MTILVEVAWFFLSVGNSIIKYFFESPKFKDKIQCTAKWRKLWTPLTRYYTCVILKQYLYSFRTWCYFRLL